MKGISSPPVGDGSISQAKLKTTTGEVSRTQSGSGFSGGLSALPGGEYGFYPQNKITYSGTESGYGRMSISYYSTGPLYPTAHSSYATRIWMGAGVNTSGDTTIYALQRYITASGKDHWIFLLVDKTTKQVIGSYQAPDHPCANQGGATEIDIPHPFGNYDPKKHEIILVDNIILKDLIPLIDYKNTLLTLINEKCLIDDTKRPKFEPREIIKINEYPEKVRFGEIIDRFNIKKTIKDSLAPAIAEGLFISDEVTKERRIIEKLPDNILFKTMRLK